MANEKENKGKKDGVGLKGIVKYTVTGSDGKVKAQGEKHNLVVTVGKEGVAKLIGSGLGGVAFAALAVGWSSQVAAAGQTTLTNEITASGLARAAATITGQTTTTAGDTARFIKSWSVSGTTTVQEVGILTNTTTAGTMIGRSLIGPVTVNNGDTLQIQYDIVVG